MQTWAFKLETATDVDIFDTVVGYVRYYEKTSGGGIDPRIRLKSLGGGINVELTPGEAYRLAVPVRGLVVENMSGGPLSGKLSIAPDGSSVDVGRLTGVVESVDGSRSRTLANVAFGAVLECPAVAGQYPHLQLWNPPATGKNIFVEKLSFYSSFAVGVLFTSHNAALSTACAYPIPQTKNVGGAVSAMRNYRQNAAALISAVPPVVRLAIAANYTETLTLAEPIMVPPGQGLILQVYNTLATDIYASVEYYEESVV